MRERGLAGVLLAAVMFPVGPVPVSDAAPIACRLPPTATDDRQPWATQRLDLRRVWPITVGAGVTVAVVDTGVDANHPQLRGHVAAGYDVVTGGRADADCSGHGTFVAGIIAAQPLTPAGFAGVAPGAQIVPIREGSTDTDGTVHSLAAGIRAAVALHAQVVNVSVVSGRDDPELRAAVRDALAHDVVLVAAAGNDYGRGDPAEYPAAYAGVLAVGAIDAQGTRASYSNTGAVGVVAPGSDLVSTGAGGSGLINGAGTSFAAPFVAGVAALVRAYHPGLAADAVVRRIEATAERPAGPLPDPQVGWGVVNPYAAVTAVLTAEHATPVPASPSALPAAAPRPRPDTRQHLAYLIAGTALLAAALVLAARLTLGAARRIRPDR